MIRQGDILFVPVEKIPEGARSQNGPYRTKRVIAEGEKTGHAHVIAVDPLNPFANLFAANDGRYLSVVKPVELKHEEHATVEIPAGNYRVVQQREWEGDESRFVND